MTTEPTTPEFRERLGRTIKEKGYNESKLAKATGISPSTIANYRNGVTKPDKTKLRTICEKLGVTVEWMLTGNDSLNMVSEDKPIYGSDKIILSDSGIEAIYSLTLELHGLKDTIKESIKDMIKETQSESQKEASRQNQELRLELNALRRAIEKLNKG